VMHTSVIYHNIHIYRLVMHILYLFKYRRRFHDVLKLISKNEGTILELCFGDIYIAEQCRTRGIEWTGVDINDGFVKYASDRGHNAYCCDLMKLHEFPVADVCIMMGSLYHFYEDIESLLLKMLNSAPLVIISEPIRNLSSKKGLIGKISRKLTNAGRGQEPLRFDRDTMIDMLNTYSRKLKFRYHIVSMKKDIIIEIIHERN
jgi:hypothetical protein